MKLEVEKKSETLQGFHIEIPADVVAKEYESAFTALQRRVKIPGFRPGRVPRNLIEQRYGKEIESDVVQKLIPDYYLKAVKETGVTPVEMPRIEKMETHKGSPWTFTALVEIKPSIGKVRMEGLEIPRQKIVVTEEEVSKTLDHLQDIHSQLEASPEDHPLQKGDFVVIHYERVDGERTIPAEKPEGSLIQIGNGKNPPELDAGLTGARKGEERDIQITFPEEPQAKELSGKTVLFKVKVGEIKKKVSPALDDEFARDLGEYESLEDLKTKVREEIRAKKEDDQLSSQRNAAIKFLIDHNPVEAPPSMVRHELEDILTRVVSNHGKTEELTDEQRRALETTYGPVAEGHVKAALILEALEKEAGIETSDEEVDAEMEQIGKRTQQEPERVRQHFASTDGALQGLKSRLRERKTVDFVLSKAVFKESPQSDSPDQP